MQIQATNKSASVTGIYAGVLGVVLGPAIDSGGAVMLFLSTLAFALPAYFLVLGVKREDMNGLWFFRPDILKRTALFIAGIVCVATITQLIFIAHAGGGK